MQSYYVSSFFWSSIVKVFNALLNFITLPLLLGYYGVDNYGVLTLAIACNSYIQLLDMGVNIGAVKYFTQWKTEGKSELIDKVATTNLTFYLFIAIANSTFLYLLAVYGENIFNINLNQFELFRKCLIILSIFSVFNWCTAAFNQLLISYELIAYTQKIQGLVILFKGLLIMIVFTVGISLVQYFFLLTLISSLALLPYAHKCLSLGIIRKIKFSFYYNDFKIIFFYSLALFALSLFQMTALQSRPIVLGICVPNAAKALTEFRIVEVFPTFIIMVGGTLSTILLPKASELISSKNQKSIESFAYKGTIYTSTLANILCFPFILSSKDILISYVGDGYAYLSKWLIIWCVTILIQIHTTPGNSLILAYGKTKILVIATGIICLLSIMINILLANNLGIGSAIIGYFIYVILIIGLYYISFYKKILSLKRTEMFLSFFKPTLIAFCVYIMFIFIPFDKLLAFFPFLSNRYSHLFIFILRGGVWIIVYLFILHCLKLFTMNKSFFKF